MELNIKVNDEKEAEKILNFLSTLQQDIESICGEKEHPKEDDKNTFKKDNPIYIIENDSIFKLEMDAIDINKMCRVKKFIDVFNIGITCELEFPYKDKRFLTKNELIEQLKEQKNQVIEFDSTSYDACLEAVKKDWRVLQYINNQTTDICLEAVKQDGWDLKYVKEQTEDICLEAVRENGMVLMYVKNQTKNICLEAVRENGYALELVKEQSEDICIKAVNQNPMALIYVKNQTNDICLEAVKQNGLALKHVREQTPEICMEAVKENGIKNVINYIDIDVIDKLLEEYDVEGK